MRDFKGGGLLIHVILVAAALLALFPFFWMVSVSLMTAEDMALFPPPLMPVHPTLQHYQALFDELAMGRYLLNSTLIALGVTISSLLINSMAGYAFAKLHFRGRDSLFRLLLAMMVIPSQAAMLPLFLMIKELGLINTYAGIIMPGMSSVFGIFLIRQYLKSVPDSLLDAARIDGAGEFRIYRSLILPLSKPVLVSLAVFTFMGSWNDFMWPLIILSQEDRYTLPVALANLMGEHVQDPQLMMAGAVLTILPVVVLFLLLQRYYLEGLVAGGVKD